MFWKTTGFSENFTIFEVCKHSHRNLLMSYRTWHKCFFIYAFIKIIISMIIKLTTYFEKVFYVLHTILEPETIISLWSLRNWQISAYLEVLKFEDIWPRNTLMQSHLLATLHRYLKHNDQNFIIDERLSFITCCWKYFFMQAFVSYSEELLVE